MRTAVLLLVSISLLASQAYAADEVDIVSLENSTPQEYGWSGIYVGATGGYGWLRDVDRAFVPPLVTRGEDWVAGVHAGFLHQWNQIVVGAEVAYQIMDIQFVGFPIWVDDATTARARVGFAHHKWLFTAHAGATYATTNIGLDDWGYNLGLAVEYMVTQNLIAGFQYDHHNFTSFDGTLIDATVDTVTLRVGYKF